MFSVNFRILAQLLTPTFMRQPVVLAWLYAALAPVAALYQRFVAARDYGAFLMFSGVLGDASGTQFDTKISFRYLYL